MTVGSTITTATSEGNAPSGVSPSESKAAPNLVTVLGFDQKDVLFRSDKVGCVQWRDADGKIVAMLISLKQNVWGFAQRGEEDWPQVLARYGNSDSQED